MSVWLWVVLVSNLIYWAVFFYLLKRGCWDAPALAFGLLHMLFASLLVTAPIRSFFDPTYVGYQIGFVRFSKGWAVLPATLVLAWALSSAWIAVGRGRGPWMKSIAVGDFLFALNLGGALLFDLVRGDMAETKIQGGEFFTLQGTLVALILFLLFVAPFVASGVWSARRAGSGGLAPPHGEGGQESSTTSDERTKGDNGFRFMEGRYAAASTDLFS